MEEAYVHITQWTKPSEKAAWLLVCDIPENTKCGERRNINGGWEFRMREGWKVKTKKTWDNRRVPYENVITQSVCIYSDLGVCEIEWVLMWHWWKTSNVWNYVCMGQEVHRNCICCKKIFSVNLKQLEGNGCPSFVGVDLKLLCIQMDPCRPMSKFSHIQKDVVWTLPLKLSPIG